MVRSFVRALGPIFAAGSLALAAPALGGPPDPTQGGGAGGQIIRVTTLAKKRPRKPCRRSRARGRGSSFSR